jgi:F-type H+-transporting ATPase subunit b
MHLDWSTLALQTVNVLVLLWLLHRFLFKPVTAIIADRRHAAEKMLAEAEAARTRASVHEAEIVRREEGERQQAGQIRAAALQAAQAERAALLRQAHEEADEARRQAEAAAERDRSVQRQQLENQAATLAVGIAERLLASVPAAQATAAVLARFRESLEHLPQEQLAALSQANGSLQVVTAVSLGNDERAQVAAALAQVLTPAPPLRFSVEPALIAGIELRAPHAVMRDHWRADLDRIAGALHRQDEQHVEPALA